MATPNKIGADRLAFLTVTTEQKRLETKGETSEDFKAKRASLKINPSTLMPGSTPRKISKVEQPTPTSEKTEKVVAKLEHTTLSRPAQKKRPPTIRERHKPESKSIPDFTPPEAQETKPVETKPEEPQIEEPAREPKEKEEFLETATLALTESPTVVTEPQKLTKATCILVNFDPKLGRLFVRGTGPGMSWSSGVEILSEEGQFKLKFEEADFEYKLLLNDQKWENVPGNGNHKAISGNTETVHPNFS